MYPKNVKTNSNNSTEPITVFREPAPEHAHQSHQALGRAQLIWTLLIASIVAVVAYHQHGLSGAPDYLFDHPTDQSQ